MLDDEGGGGGGGVRRGGDDDTTLEENRPRQYAVLTLASGGTSIHSIA